MKVLIKMESEQQSGASEPSMSPTCLRAESKQSETKSSVVAHTHMIAKFQFPRKYLNLFGTCLYIQPKPGAINNNWLLRCSGLHFACIPRDTLHSTHTYILIEGNWFRYLYDLAWKGHPIDTFEVLRI